MIVPPQAGIDLLPSMPLLLTLLTKRKYLKQFCWNLPCLYCRLYLHRITSTVSSFHQQCTFAIHDIHEDVGSVANMDVVFSFAGVRCNESYIATDAECMTRHMPALQIVLRFPQQQMNVCIRGALALHSQGHVHRHRCVLHCAFWLQCSQAALLSSVDVVITKTTIDWPASNWNVLDNS